MPVLRLLFTIVAAMLSSSFGQGVNQVEPTFEDLIMLLGEVTVLELEVPPEATVFFDAFTSPDGYVEGATLLHEADADGRRTVRILILVPGRPTLAAPCEGDVIEVHVVMAGMQRATTPHCLPRPAGVTFATHELVLPGDVGMNAWTPVYVRSWTAVEEGVPGSGTILDLENAFTIQVGFATGDIAGLSNEPPLDVEALSQVPGIAERSRTRPSEGGSD